MYEKYSHHGADVWVRSDLKGKHRSFCLCFACGKFKPGQPDNCPIANAIYQNCVKYNLTTPVFECPSFEVIKHEHTGEVVSLEEIKANPSLQANMLGLKVMIRSQEHNSFWRDGCHGYTPDAWEAGIYDFAEAYERTKHCCPKKGIQFVVI